MMQGNSSLSFQQFRNSWGGYLIYINSVPTKGIEGEFNLIRLINNAKIHKTEQYKAVIFWEKDPDWHRMGGSGSFMNENFWLAEHSGAQS